MANIIMQITDYIAHLWHNTSDDIVMAENINGWEDTLQQHSQFLKRFSWQPNTTYPKNSVLLYPFGLHTKLVSKNAGISGSVEPTWSEATGVEGSRTIQDNDIVWEEQPIQISSDTTPVGTIKQQLWNSAPPGYLKLDKSVILNRSEYPELWDFVQKYMPLTTEVKWQKMLTQNGTSVGFFSQGDGSTTFRTPIMLDFGRGGSSAGAFFKDQNKLHNHTANIDTTPAQGSFRLWKFDPAATGVFSSSYLGNWANSKNGGSDSMYQINFNLANVLNNITIASSGASEGYPKHVTMPFYLRTLNI